MPPGKVYFANLRTSFKENLFAKIARLVENGLKDAVMPRDLVAIKMHFGEKGNTAFIRPIFVRQIVDSIKGLGGLPFLTDTNTLYSGTRANSVSHLDTAVGNGFAYSVVNAPIIIADGMRGASYSAVRIDQEIFETAYLGKEIVESDALIGVAHFKGHELSGFGGTIKNIGMGCASRKGKLEQHSGVSPRIKRKKCVGCGECIKHCASEAIKLVEEKAFIEPEKCVGCGECILICNQGAIDVQWDADMSRFQKKMVEYAYAVLKGKQGKSFFINFLTNISPACDCYPHSDTPIVQDIGIMASKDPVAIDQASVDMVNREKGADGSCLTSSKGPGEDKFRAVYPAVDWSIQLEYGEKIGLGTRSYDLEII
ncbi:MAG: DUF362 domain-containing protein [Deltaproteobacteria bacterium]|nr:DUF362 domain-containing protein [Deltaproteobacteria bacterium]